MRKNESVEAVVKRNREVLRLHRRGVTPLQIALRVGLTRQRVYQILQAARTEVAG
jgi:DNA-binding CsgD family transcriptional regulator